MDEIYFWLYGDVTGNTWCSQRWPLMRFGGWPGRFVVYSASGNVSRCLQRQNIIYIYVCVCAFWNHITNASFFCERYLSLVIFCAHACLQDAMRAQSCAIISNICARAWHWQDLTLNLAQRAADIILSILCTYWTTVILHSFISCTYHTCWFCCSLGNLETTALHIFIWKWQFPAAMRPFFSKNLIMIHW